MAVAPSGDVFVAYTAALPRASTNVVRIRKHAAP
jgi:hypothetical protein